MNAPQPVPILALCDAATKGPWKAHANVVCARTPDKFGDNVAQCTHKSSGDDERMANAQLIARLSPEVVRAVYEALTTAHAYATASAHYRTHYAANALNTIALLDGHNPEVK